MYLPSFYKFDHLVMRPQRLKEVLPAGTSVPYALLHAYVFLHTIGQAYGIPLIFFDAQKSQQNQ
jgi:hypothetical protein